MKKKLKYGNFSVIFSVYFDDKISYFKHAYQSVCNQSLVPKQIIISIDGKLKKSLYDFIINLNKKNKVTLVKNKINKGQGYARNLGIKKAKYSIVAVMDSDDVCHYKRFELQFKKLKEMDYDIVGSNIVEFSKTIKFLENLRIVPEQHKDILALGNWRTPMNGATIMFKKSCYYKSGGYPFDVKNFEDYILIARFIKKKFKCHNIQKPLLFVRTNNSWISRRSGLNYLKSDFNLAKKLYNENLINFFSFISHIFLRTIIRIMPSILILKIYKIFFRTKFKIDSNE